MQPLESSQSSIALSSTRYRRAYLEVAFSDRPLYEVAIQELPFLIGRGRENGNHLSLEDRRISRKCAAIYPDGDGLWIEDRGQLNGIFVNDQQREKAPLRDGDRIRLGFDDGCQLVFRIPSEDPKEHAVTTFRNLLGSITGDSADELKSLRVLLEATSLLQSRLPLDSVLATMLDHAVAITHADRGMLLEPAGAGQMPVKLARDKEGNSLPVDAMNPSRTVIRQALEQQSAIVREDLNLADLNLQAAASIVVQRLRSAVVIPLYCHTPQQSGLPTETPSHELLGAIYLDSKSTSAFSELDRQILDALGAQAASVLDHARLVLREQERQRLEQELTIARQIQQGLVPQGPQDFPHLAVTGLHKPCHEVGGDYFDVFPLSDGRVALLIADVSGKGLGAALLTTMLQGALSGMTLGVDPVKVFHHLNHFLCEHASIGRYATMFFALLDPNGTLEFVRASHPSPLLLRNGAVSELYSGGSFPIGLIAEATFTASRIQLQPDDMLVLFTDGVTEAEDPNHNQFGLERLKAVLTHHANHSLSDLQTRILQAVEVFAHDSRQSDDITLLLLRYRRPSDNSGPGASASPGA